MKCENLIKFIKYFGKGRKFRMCGFFILSSIAAFMEFIGIAMIYPVILLLVNQERFAHTSVYKIIESTTHIADPFANALIIGSFVIAVFILKNLFMVWFFKMQWKFVTYWKRDIKKIFIQYFLYSDYSSNIKISTADKIYESTAVIEQAMDSFVLRCFTLLTNLIIISVIIALLLIKFPTAAITAMCFIAVSLYLQDKFFKKQSLLIGEKHSKINRAYNKDIHNLFTNLKEIAIFSKQEYFFEKNMQKANENAKILIEYQFFTSIPPYIVEILVVIALFILAGIISAQNPGNSTEIVASLAIIAAAIFRISPALNRIQVSLSTINVGRNYVKRLNQNYETFDIAHFKPIKIKPFSRWNFTNSIELKNITFAYNETPVIKNVSLKIEKGDFIGIIGLSGAGKTTLADIIMGLLKPQEGEIYVDGVKLTALNYPNFRQAIAYVPQNITVLESSFKDNVAWGVDEKDIDDEKVIKALQYAQLYDVVETYPEGINAIPIIGSGGLSQGQRQRLAIARALYRTPDIIIFDEATSALDVKIEHDITEMLNNNLAKDKTMIAIAHRLSTLKACNKLVYMKDGVIVDIGTFTELSAQYEDFDELIKLSSIK